MSSLQRHRKSRCRQARALVICGFAFLAPLALLAESSGEDAASEAPAKAGLRAYLDPETGELTSTPSREQVEALSEKILSEEARWESVEPALSRSSAGLEPFVLERGGRGVFLEGRFRSALVARRRADGSFALVCEDAADHAIGAPASPPPAVSPQWIEK